MTVNRVTSTGSEQEISNVQRIASDGSLANANAIERVLPNDMTETVWTDVDEGEYLNLASEVPQYAMDLWFERPNLRDGSVYNLMDATNYAGRTGDLADRIEEASANDAIVDLGSGEYEMGRAIDPGAIYDVVGAVGDGARIYYVGTDESEALFDVSWVEDFVLAGITFDITEDDGSGFNTDVGIVNARHVSNRAWTKDITLTGQRHRWQDLDGDGSPERVGDFYTFRVDVDEGATGFHENIQLPDGGTDMSQEKTENPDDPPDTSGHAVAFSADPYHQGLNVWKDCYAEGFFANGFYMTTDVESGENVVWNCHARNCGRGGIRVSWHDTVIGGLTECDTVLPGGDDPEGQKATPFVFDYGTGVDVIGLRIEASSDGWSAEAIQHRTDAQDIRYEKCVLHVQSGQNRPMRIGSNEGVEVTANDIYWYDEAPDDPDGSPYMVNISTVFDNPGTLILEDSKTCRIRSENKTEFNIGSPGTLQVDGETYSLGSYSASDLGVGDPLDDTGALPDFYFEYEQTPAN